MEEKKPYRGAKIPAEDNGIRVRRTVCDICDAGCNIITLMTAPFST